MSLIPSEASNFLSIRGFNANFCLVFMLNLCFFMLNFCFFTLDRHCIFSYASFCHKFVCRFAERNLLPERKSASSCALFLTFFIISCNIRLLSDIVLLFIGGKRQRLPPSFAWDSRNHLTLSRAIMVALSRAIMRRRPQGRRESFNIKPRYHGTA